MKKIVKIFLILFIFSFISLIPLVTYASESDYLDELSSYDLSSFDDLPSDTKSILKSLGIDDFNYQSIADMSFSDIVNILKDMLKENIKDPLKSVSIILAFTVLSAFFTSFNEHGIITTNANVYSTASSVVISLLIVGECSKTISLCCSTIAICADFVFAFVPAFFTIVAVGGGAMTSLSTNSLLLCLAQGLNFISSKIFIPIVNCFLALLICSGMRSELNVYGLINAVKKIVITSISVVSGGFVAILSIKTAVASRADALGLRSLRFAINSVVPVIGSAISEGLLSIQSYSSLVKSSVGIVGIISVCAIFLPAMISVVVWRISLYFAKIISDVFEDHSVSRIISSFSDAFLLMNVILILSMVTTIISVGILVAAKTSP